MNEEFIHKWESQVKKGILELVVLNILNNRDYYGYELIEEIRNYTLIDIAEGTLYPLLIRLKESNLVLSEWVEQDSGIPRKYYSITMDGKTTLKELNIYWENLTRSIQKITTR